tara:strand:+ start:339 stop:767 length:429 start_codon:yes stop_codon:yes gene_type:complete
MNKTFRGLLADGAQNTIRLSTNDGLTGYKIKDFRIIHAEPGQQDGEHTVKVYTTKRSTVDNAINFDDPTLLAVAYLTDDKNILGTVSNIIVFDSMVFNQDIFVTHEDTTGSQPCNYYLELETMKLDINEATVATLKDMRGRE